MNLLRSLSKSCIVIAAFCSGVLFSLMIIFIVVFSISTSYTLRDIEENTAIPTISDKYIGEYPEVYIRDMTLVEMLKEGKELADMGNGLTLNVLISRYDLRLPEKADIFLTESVRDLPLKQVFSEEGFDLIMNTVYIGEFRGFEQREIDGKIVWCDPVSGEAAKGINRVISGLTLAETLSSDFSLSELLDDLTLGEALGYNLVDGVYYDKNGAEVTGMIGVVCDSHINDVSDRINNVQLSEIFGYKLGEDGYYYDKNNERVTGVMSVICDATVNTVPEKVNAAKFCDVLGYTLDENGDYWDGDKKVTGVMKVIADCTVTSAPDKINNANMGEILGYTYDSEAEAWKDSEGKEVHSFMNTISGKKINELNNLYKELTIADVIPADERDGDKGYVSLLNPETPLDQISGEVNRVFKQNTMKQFIECGAITFENDPDGTKAAKFTESKFGDMTMDQMIGFVVNNLDTLVLLTK